MIGSHRIIVADVLDGLAQLPDESIQCVVTSPPYWGLRDYGVPGQIGLESTFREYVDRLTAVFREAKRVLRANGTLWLNLGDCYAGGAGGRGDGDSEIQRSDGSSGKPSQKHDGTRLPRDKGALKPKDLVGVPWRVAFALQADGWYLRSDIIWCLSGGAKVYARTQKGEMPTTIKDVVRLDPSTVQLWNGEKWTQVLGWSESTRPDEPLEIELRSGERIGCTPGHEWPTQRGPVRADELRLGDIIDSCRLPEPPDPLNPTAFGTDAAWLVGLYLAEGSWSDDTIQIASHVDEVERRIERVKGLVCSLGGTVRAHATKDKAATIAIDCPPLAAMIRQYVRGRSAKTKGLKVRTWRHSDEWLAALLDGYLAGDGHHDEANDRWRLGFTRNDALASHLRTLAARLGHRLTLHTTHGEGFGQTWPIYRGEIRLLPQSGHHNEKNRAEVVAIGRSRARRFWDIGVADKPHTFALASGILTHNSKPNPMPESVTDRPTKSHEYLFLLSKNARYHYDADAIKEPGNSNMTGRVDAPLQNWDGRVDGTVPGKGEAHSAGTRTGGNLSRAYAGVNWALRGRNLRSVWTIPTQPFPDAHFATFPEKLVEPCVKAGTKPGDTVLDPFAGSGTTGVVACLLGRDFLGIELNPTYAAIAERRIGKALRPNTYRDQTASMDAPLFQQPV